VKGISYLSIPSIIAVVALGIWLYLLFFRGGYWRVWEFNDDFAAREMPAEWPRVVAIVPARNEAETIGKTVKSLLRQDYPGEFSVFVVDDHSDDGSSLVAQRAARDNAPKVRVTVDATSGLPAGWTGKLWALNEGVRWSSADLAAYYWFTDADVVHAPDTLRRLIARAKRSNLDLVSLMVLLRAKTIPERALIPAFLFFFLKLYPPRWIADVRSQTAGAAGGCIVLRREALEHVGGLQAIRGEVIDDCALARAVKRSGGRIWMGLTQASISLRAYRRIGEIRDMIARTAFTQLRYSPAFLFAALTGMFVTYLAPVVLVFSSHPVPRFIGLAALILMMVSYLPVVRFYRLSLLWAPFLPLTALYFSYATWLSAARYWLGRGGQWKGRTQAGKKNVARD
jgi:hopene-associated glycosyltransferase HpnB